nr:TrkH family potassium uptake protein [bacterium]
MNYRMIRYFLGQLLKVHALLMCLPLALSLIDADGARIPFLITVTICGALGLLMTLKKPENKAIFAREGFIIVALSWVMISLIGALPYTLSGYIPHYLDAVFETVSGFTTTGSSILTDIEALPRSLLFWRSFAHWIGGMGVLVFVLALLPKAEFQTMHVMRAEVPGPTVGKLVSKMRLTAQLLYGIYLFLSIAEVILLLLGGMPFFDSVVGTFATAGTGGFSIKNASIAFYDSAYCDAVITVFMLLFSINFNLFYLILFGQVTRALKSEELHWFFGIVAAAICLITINILPLYPSLGKAFRYASFQVASIISTTGFSTADYTTWPAFSQAIIVGLMIIGACAGSTGGGIKVARLIILIKTGFREAKRTVNPRSVIAIKLDGQPVEREVIHGVSAFFTLHVLLFAISTLVVSLDQYDFPTSASAVVTCINNVGPGLGAVGPSGNFAGFSCLSKLVLILDMLLGRLEIYPILLALSPMAWRRR